MRNYRKEYRDYHSKPKQIKNRSSRNKARAIMKKIRGIKSIKGKDIDHKNKNPRDNRIKNLRIVTTRENNNNKGEYKRKDYKNNE